MFPQQNPLLSQELQPRNPENNRFQNAATVQAAPFAFTDAQNALASSASANPLSRNRQIFCPCTTAGTISGVFPDTKSGIFAFSPFHTACAPGSSAVAA